MKYLILVLILAGCASEQQKQCEKDGGQFHDNLCWNKPLPPEYCNGIWCRLPPKDHNK
jgi:hypothetical protein